MDFNTFKEQALRTENTPSELRVNPQVFSLALNIAFYTGELLNLFKRAAVYGKPIDGKTLDELSRAICVNAAGVGDHTEFVNDTSYDIGIAFAAEDGAAVPITTASFPMRQTHAILGVFTESAELVEALLMAVSNNKPLDRVNVGEEFGDIDWYKALAFDDMNLDEVATRVAVIEKLKKRYGEKFTADAAINRDLDAEREILNESIGT